MSKKKIIIFLVLIVLVVGAVVGGIFLFSPKPNTELPYELSYNVAKNETLTQVKTNNSKLYSYMQKFPTSTDSEKQALVEESQAYIKSFSAIISLAEAFEKADNFILNNIAFLNEKDLVQNQQKLEKSYEAFNEDLAICVEFYNKNIKPLEDQNNTNSYMMFNQIKNYSTYAYNMIDSLSDFYYYSTQILANNGKTSFTLNEYSKLVAKTLGQWAKLVANNKTNAEVDIAVFSSDLKEFVTSKITILNLYASYEFSASQQQIVANSANVDMPKLLEEMMKGTLDEYVNSFADIDFRQTLSNFISSYLEIDVVVNGEVA